jgi:hypothetical protein
MTMKLKAAAIMTKAISTMAASKPIIPRLYWMRLFVMWRSVVFEVFWLHDGQVTFFSLDFVCHL